MQDDEGGELGVDPNEQFRHTEAISAVVDDGFLGEEDDDFEDLYNDVNVGENLFPPMNHNEVIGDTNEVGVADSVSINKTSPQPLNLVPDTAMAGVGEVERNLARGEGESSAQLYSGRVPEGYQQKVGAGGQIIGGCTDGSVEAPGEIGLIVEPGQQHINKRTDVIDEHIASRSFSGQGGGLNSHTHPPAQSGVSATHHAGIVGNLGNEGLPKHGGGNVSGVIVNVTNGYGNIGVGGGAPLVETGGARGGGGATGQGTMLFVGDLHWWTTDAELETELCKYGIVKEVRFYDEKASGKSKGYCQVEFYDASATTACKEGMHGHMFNGRPCVVTYASPFTVKRMGEAQLNRNHVNQPTLPPQITAAPVIRRATADVPGRPGGNNIVSGGNYQGAGDTNRGYGRGNWPRGNGQGMGGRGPVAPMRNRPGGMGGRGMMGNGGMGFGQGMGGAPPFLPPHQSMMGPGFDPSFGGPMARMGGYGGGFPGGPNPPFSGMMPPFPPVGTVGLPGVAPHVNPAFFGRGMPMNGMGMMPSGAVDGPNSGMWGDHNMGSWASEDHGGRAGESSYGEEVISDHQYGEGSHDRGPWPKNIKEKDRGSERDWSGSPDRKHRDDRESVYDRDMDNNDNEWSERGHRNERDVGRDRARDRDRDRERSRDRERNRDQEREHDRSRQQEDKDQLPDHRRRREQRVQEHEDELDRGRSSRARSKSRLSSHEEEQRVRSRDGEYGKRRRSDN